MKIIFHEKFLISDYAWDSAAAQGRLDGIMRLLSGKGDRYEIVTPAPASKADILRAHTEGHYENIKKDNLLFELSMLAAGGSIRAAEEAMSGNPSFAVIRPPGHHASADSCWGFCYFNNISVSLLKLFSDGLIKSAFVLDFDLHTGDGNINILQDRDDGFKVTILNPKSSNNDAYIEEVENFMNILEDIDIFAASAGFDQGIDDWGNLLHPEDYKKLGGLMKKYSEKLCNGRRYALLEGGYNHIVIGTNVYSFCEGFR